MDAGKVKPQQKIPPRALAIKMIGEVLTSRRPLDEIFAFEAPRVESQYRAWLQDVCSGVFRNRGKLDQAIDSFAISKKPSGWLRRVLWVSVYQLLFQDRAHPGGVVSETVDLVKSKEGGSTAKFANALLRRVSEQAEQWRNWAPAAQSKEAALSVSMPDWLWHRLVKDFGREDALTLSRSFLDRPVIWMRAREILTSEQLDAWGLEPLEGHPLTYRLSASAANLGSHPGIESGAIMVQDLASQTLIDKWAPHLLSLKCSVLDLCAAPGGKSVAMSWAGIPVVASDRPGVRFDQLELNIQKLSPQARVISKNLLPLSEGAQKAIWVDAPCTATGILRRHPEIKWLKREDELKPIGETQRELLREAWQALAPGGTLIYSVCSVLKDEGEGRLGEVSLTPYVKETLFVDPRSGSDGFWGALLIKA
jgi:16S rRNA (cytosine967-C5)-methyltransferase